MSTCCFLMPAVISIVWVLTNQHNQLWEIFGWKVTTPLGNHQKKSIFSGKGRYVVLVTSYKNGSVYKNVATWDWEPCKQCCCCVQTINTTSVSPNCVVPKLRLDAYTYLHWSKNLLGSCFSHPSVNFVSSSAINMQMFVSCMKNWICFVRQMSPFSGYRVLSPVPADGFSSSAFHNACPIAIYAQSRISLQVQNLCWQQHPCSAILIKAQCCTCSSSCCFAL